MTDRIADALVLVFTPGMSLREWDTLGLLEREWALYERLLPHYSRVLLVTFGSGDDLQVLGRLGPRVDLICNSSRLDAARYLATIPARAAEALGASASVLVKTNQFPAGPGAAAIADALRARAATGPVALLARGGYLASRFVAREKGPASVDARRAGEVESTLCRAADLVVGTSADMTDDLAWRYGLEPEGVRLIPNYVLTDYPPAGVAEREPGLVLYCGQLTARKRVDILIDAVAGLPDSLRPGVSLRIIGHGPEEARLKARAAERRIRCEFRPRMPHRDLLKQMSRCTVYAQASELEGHPRTVIEAMGAGAPVLVADSPGLGNVVQNGATGLRIPGNAESFAQSLAALLSDPEWRELLGTAAASTARQTWGLDLIVPLELDAHRAAMHRAAQRSGSTGAACRDAEVRWEPDLLNASPTVAADRWMHSLEAFARRLSNANRAELIARLEQSLRGREPRSAA